MTCRAADAIAARVNTYVTRSTCLAGMCLGAMAVSCSQSDSRGAKYGPLSTAASGATQKVVTCLMLAKTF